jgi:cell division protease FtsH
VTERVNPLDPVQKISLFSRITRPPRFEQQLFVADRYLLQRHEFFDVLTTLCSGRAAEQLGLNDVSTIGADDLQQATEIARHMVALYGMSEEIGPVSYQVYSAGFSGLRREKKINRGVIGETVIDVIDKEVRRIVRMASDRALEILAADRHSLDELAKLLSDQEVVEREELTKRLLQQVDKGGSV